MAIDVAGTLNKQLGVFMKNALAILSATTVLTLAASAFADDIVKGESKMEYKDNGGYESTQSSERVTGTGTKHVTESNVDVDVDSKGRVSKTVETEKTTDPKGLLNTKKDNATTEIEEKARGGYKQTTTRAHTDREGTDIVNKSTTNVDVDAKGNVTEVVKTEKVVDPKGLLNKSKAVSKTKTVNGRVVEDTATHN
jgi:hypothetical protein